MTAVFKSQTHIVDLLSSHVAVRRSLWNIALKHRELQTGHFCIGSAKLQTGREMERDEEKFWSLIGLWMTGWNWHSDVPAMLADYTDQLPAIKWIHLVLRCPQTIRGMKKEPDILGGFKLGSSWSVVQRATTWATTIEILVHTKRDHSLPAQALHE